jgi:hypothetical protein
VDVPDRAKKAYPNSDEAEHKKNNVRVEAITLLAEHLFLTKQMGWRKGLKMFQDRGEECRSGSNLHTYQSSIQH